MTHFKKYFMVIIIFFQINYNISLEFVNQDLQDSSLQINISTGIIQGRKSETIHKNVTYFIFQGIPYAEPPIGFLRWKPPIPSLPWEGVLNATYERSICVQMSTDEGDENCLYINVYTPQNVHKLNESKLIPVMVWIYGGRFANGFSNYSIYGPDYLLEHDVVFVSFNYRLGFFGFLSAQDLVLPGNYGLKDQVEALRWVNKNIDKFGGNPRNVTIFGDSAGAACISYLLLIPQTKGLFHRTISESGSALCPWALQRDPKKIVIVLAYACGIFETNTTIIIEKMRQEDSKKLRSRYLAINLGNAIEPLNGLPFAPCIEPAHDGAVITNKSNELFLTGKFHRVPQIMGFTSQEAAIVQDFITITRPYIAHWDVLPQLIVPQNLNVTSKTIKKEVAKKIKEFYFGKKFISMSTKTEMMNFLGDSQFVKSIIHAVRICSKYTNIYLYMFSYEGFLGRYGTRKEIARKVKGAGHVEDLFYLFRKENLTSKSNTDLSMISIMSLLWTNFAKYNTPTPISGNNFMNIYWPPINSKDSNLYYLNIDTSMSIRINPREQAMDFWDDLYKEYANKEYDTF